MALLILAITTFAAYASGVFSVTGGVIFLPEDAALLGVVAAVYLGFVRAGLLFAWAAPIACFVGFRAEWAFFGLSTQSFSEQFAFLFQLDGLAFIALIGIGIGTLGYGLGSGVRYGLALIAAAE